MNTTTRTDSPWIKLMPPAFVLLWSTGFIGAKYGLPYAEPFTLLLYRMLLTLVLLGLLAWLCKACWPRSLGQILHLAVTGLLVHGLYLGGVFSAIEAGMPAGLTALVVGLQPLLTALIAALALNESVSRRAWLGLALGLLGVGLVLSEKLAGPTQPALTGFPTWALLMALLALVGISVGTLYQKRFCSQQMDLLSGAFIQYCAATLVFALAAVSLERMEVQWTPQLLLTLGWLVLGLSLGAIGLLLLLIKRGASAQVASLFYLVTPVTALEAWLLFDERLGLAALIGTAITVGGVYLVMTPPQSA